MRSLCTIDWILFSLTEVLLPCVVKQTANMPSKNKKLDIPEVEIVRTFLSTVLGIDARGMLLPSFQWLKKESLCGERQIGHRTLYINKQVTTKQRERKRFELPNFKDLKVNPDNEAKLVDGKLFVKGKLQTKFLPPVLPPLVRSIYDLTKTKFLH